MVKIVKIIVFSLMLFVIGVTVFVRLHGNRNIITTQLAPFSARVYINQAQCSGSFIRLTPYGQTLVLTAAHCIIDELLSHIQVRDYTGRVYVAQLEYLTYSDSADCAILVGSFEDYNEFLLLYDNTDRKFFFTRASMMSMFGITEFLAFVTGQTIIGLEQALNGESGAPVLTDDGKVFAVLSYGDDNYFVAYRISSCLNAFMQEYQ